MSLNKKGGNIFSVEKKKYSKRKITPCCFLLCPLYHTLHPENF